MIHGFFVENKIPSMEWDIEIYEKSSNKCGDGRVSGDEECDLGDGNTDGKTFYFCFVYDY